jgi:hypothetical protein
MDDVSAHVGEAYYLYYYGNESTNGKTLHLPKGNKYHVDVLDTWNMTVTELEGTYEGTFSVNWPGAKYIAVRIYKSELQKEKK